MPGQPAEQLLEVMSFRRADGSEVSLGEFPIEQVVRSGETVRAEEMLISVADGRSLRVLVNATPIRAEDGAVGSVVLTIQDLAPLDEIERLRTEFLGLVSHELPEPLAAIRGSATTLLEDAAALDPAEMREFHRIIAEQSGHMRGLIGDLLDAGRLDTGTLSVSPEPSELAELVVRARETFVGGGGRHGIAVDLPVALPRTMADRRRIVQVLNNLFANAARAAPESAPIRVSAVSEGGQIAVSVADAGRGIAPEQLPRLFDKHAFGGSKAGYGLGLAICKGLVEAHGGRIRAESAGVGHGATVTFTLPAAGEPAEPPPGRQPVGKPRILVVDDDPRMLRSVRDTLAGAGYAPLVTGEPGEIAQIVRSEKPRLVLLDLISKSQVSRLCGEIDGKIRDFLDRPLEGDWPYLWLDATYVKMREAGRVVPVAVTIAVAVNDRGRREVLGMAVGASEAETFWTGFLRSLARRGLRGVKLVISDDHKGLKAAATRILGATWQRCRVHFMRNLLAHAGRQGRRVVSAFVATAFVQEDAHSASAQWRQVADQLRTKAPKLAALMDEAEHEVLAYMTFPAAHRTKLHSTNPLERLHGEIKRRTNTVGIFPNEDAITRLIGAILLEQNDEWAGQRARYMTLEAFAPVSDNAPVKLPAVAA